MHRLTSVVNSSIVFVSDIRFVNLIGYHKLYMNKTPEHVSACLITRTCPGTYNVTRPGMFQHINSAANYSIDHCLTRRLTVNMVTCPFCKHREPTKSRLHIHFKMHHYFCCRCIRWVSTKLKYKVHLIVEHEINGPEQRKSFLGSHPVTIKDLEDKIASTADTDSCPSSDDDDADSAKA